MLSATLRDFWETRNSRRLFTGPRLLALPILFVWITAPFLVGERIYAAAFGHEVPAVAVASSAEKSGDYGSNCKFTVQYEHGGRTHTRTVEVTEATYRHYHAPITAPTPVQGWVCGMGIGHSFQVIHHDWPWESVLHGALVALGFYVLGAPFILFAYIWPLATWLIGRWGWRGAKATAATPDEPGDGG